MNVGTICYTTHQGISHLARDFHRHGIINRVFPVSHPDPSHEDHPEMYPDAYTDASEFLEGLDVLMVIETTLNSGIARVAARRGVKIVLIPMYEYTPHPFPVRVDLCICPSLLDLELYRDSYKCVHLTVPVEREWKPRDYATRFIHNAGHGQYQYAKGTPELLEAMKYVESDVTLSVRAQPCPQMANLFRRHINTPRVELHLRELSEYELYEDGDVFVYPEKFNGLSLPLQEAYASGLLVMTTNRFPSNTWLPTDPLIPVADHEHIRIRGGSSFSIRREIIDPRDIAVQIDAWHGRGIRAYSEWGREWAEANSWANLKPKYMDALCQL